MKALSLIFLVICLYGCTTKCDRIMEENLDAFKTDGALWMAKHICRAESDSAARTQFINYIDGKFSQWRAESISCTGSERFSDAADSRMSANREKLIRMAGETVYDMRHNGYCE